MQQRRVVISRWLEREYTVHKPWLSPHLTFYSALYE
jgi:hypothetical protein